MALRKHCDHCGTEIIGGVGDVAAIEPVAKAWTGGNFTVRVVLTGAITTKADEYPTADPESWLPLDLCQQCFEFVLDQAVRAIIASGEEARRRAQEDNHKKDKP